MNLNVSREKVQAFSLILMAIGISLLALADYSTSGIALISLAIWIMLMSESVLLAKVQLEMMTAMESISKRKEREVEQVLYFLRQSYIAASPFESIDGAKKLCDRFHVPAMVISINHQIIKANSLMHDTLGWNYPALNNVHAHTINDPLMMSKIGSWAAHPKNVMKKSMTSHYIYVNKSGEKISGLMHATKIGVLGFYVIFYPDCENAFTYDDVEKIIIDSKLQN